MKVAFTFQSILSFIVQMSKYKLQIENPCQENWQDMIPKGRGRFCDSCDKTVIDFTQSCNQEIFRFLQNKKGNTCGRFNEDQMNRFFEAYQNHPWVLPVAGSISLLSMLFAQEISKAQNSETVRKVSKVELVEFTLDKVVLSSDDTIVETNIYLNGVVKDINQEPMPYCNVMLYNDSVLVNGLHTDFDGRFRFEIPQNMYNDSLRFTVSFVGYSHYEQIFIPEQQLPNDLNIALKEDHQLMGDVVIVRDTPWKRFKRWWNK